MDDFEEVELEPVLHLLSFKPFTCLGPFSGLLLSCFIGTGPSDADVIVKLKIIIEMLRGKLHVFPNNIVNP